ncbi:unnamed protein product [Danaus chrysippus]|uniref:(African queen) hypothetical protein n=1 Tax=Danaus chrysippus TaxID=151541 RepID=A0A8J2Q085_9NEOP|nr:unnamed protein product [Danaus chrysippus]
MFVYEFMAGIVEQITGGEDEESFDPHQHRRVERPTSYSDTMTHLLKGSIGAGILAMADAVARVGIIFSVVGILMIGSFATYCIQLLVCDYHGQVMSLRTHLFFLLLPLTLMGLVKNLKLLTPFSSISNIVTIFGFILVFFYLIEDDVTIEDEKLQLKGLEEIPFFIGTTLFALEAVGVVLALEYNMEQPKRFVGFFGLFNIGMAIIMSLYLLMGIFGYLKYGDNIKASITLNLPQNQKKAQAAKVIFAMAIFLTFPLQNFVAYTIIYRKIHKKVSGTKLLIVDYLLRVALVILPWLAAVAVPKLGPFIALFGAFCLSLLSMVFPGIMDACVWYADSYGMCRYRLIRDIFIVFVGLAFLVSGCYTSLLEIAASSEH